MSAVDPYEYDEPRRHRSSRHRDRREDREPRYVETQETYVRGSAPVIPEPPTYSARTTEMIRRPDRQDSDLSIEEVRRDFPPPGAGAYVQQRSMIREDRYGPPARARSAERGAYLDPREERRSRKATTYEEKTVEPRRRSLSRNQKIIAGVAGAALAVGSKELFDRRQAQGRAVSRNHLQSAALGAAGAFAAYEGAELYAKHAGKGEEKTKTYIAHRGRNGEVAEYYSSDEEPEKPKKSRRKSIVEGALGLAGLGAAAKAVGGGRDKSRSRRGSQDSYTSRRSGRSRSRGGRGKSPEGAAKFQQAAKAALLAGATEAFRVRNEPGGWGGPKGKRIITAAIGAGSIDAAADRNPDHNSKRHILEAVVGGLAGNRLINGSRNNVEDDRGSRRGSSRSRSRGPSGGGGGGGAGLAALATAGLGALAAKKVSDRSRSRSRGGDRRRRDSPDSYDSRSPSRDRRHKRSKSVTDYARKGLAALGIGEAAEAADDHDRRRTEVVEETHVHRSSRRRRSPDDDYDDRRGSTRDAGSARDNAGYVRDRGDRDRGDRDRGDPYGDPRYADSRSSVGGGSTRNGGDRRAAARAKDGQRNKRIAEGKQSDSDSSSLGSSSEDEKRIKKMKGKQLITAGLASVATIHAAHNVYQSMEQREARHKAVQEGEMTPEEARKLKAKATLQDTASIAIAALGIKGAFSEIKEANELRHETREFREKKEERHKKRLERLERLKKQKPGDGGGRRYDNGPRYLDGNPYSAGALPAPPVGYNGR